MEQIDFDKLGTGDIIRHVGGGRQYLVHVNYGEHIVISDTRSISNCIEWELIARTNTETKSKPDPPKSKFMEEWNLQLADLGKRRTITPITMISCLVLLIDKHKEDKVNG